MFDVFVVAHTLGWWAKALLLRHRGMLWAGSILFEVLEFSLHVRASYGREHIAFRPSHRIFTLLAQPQPPITNGAIEVH